MKKKEVRLIKGKKVPIKGTKCSIAQLGNTNSVGNKGGTGNPRYAEKWKDANVDLCFKFSLLGATEERLAEMFGVTKKTIFNWMHRNPAFREAYENGRAKADAEIAYSLYHRAKGFEHDDIELKVVSLGDGMGSEVQQIPVRRIYPPDTTAVRYWLNNRNPAKWADKKEGEGNTTNNIKQVFIIAGQEITFE